MTNAPRSAPPDMGQSPAAGESMDAWREALSARKTVAETDKIYIDAGVLAPADVCISRFGDEGWMMELQPVEPHVAAVRPGPFAAGRDLILEAGVREAVAALIGAAGGRAPSALLR